jgi:hypothetical protein
VFAYKRGQLACAAHPPARAASERMPPGHERLGGQIAARNNTLRLSKTITPCTNYRDETRRSIACGNAAKVLELLKAPLDAVALAVKRATSCGIDELADPVGGNHGLHAGAGDCRGGPGFGVLTLLAGRRHPRVGHRASVATLIVYGQVGQRQTPRRSHAGNDARVAEKSENASEQPERKAGVGPPYGPLR